MIEYIANDTIEQSATLWQNKAAGEILAIPVDGSATLKAFIVDPKRNKLIVSAVPILHTDTDNDWPNGEIFFKFDQANTGVLSSYDGDQIVVAVRLTINNKNRTFKQSVKAVKMPLNIG